MRAFILFLCFYSFIFAQKQVLILNSYHKGFEWSDIIVEGIQNSLRQEDIGTNVLYMDSKRISSEDYFAKIGELYKIQLDNRHYDLIIAVDTFAYNFTLKYYHMLFKDEPILFTGLESFDKDKIIKRNLQDRVYGILEKRAIEQNFSLILKLMPKLKKLYIINDSSDNGNDTNPFIQKQISTYAKRFEISYIRKSTLHELNQLFSTYKENEAIFFVRFYNDKHSNYYKNTQIASMIDKSKLPVFVTDTLFLGKGALGGELVDIKQLGIKTTKKALDILQGNVPSLSVDLFLGDRLAFDFKKAKQFKFVLKDKFKNIFFVNGPLSFFEKYRALVNDIFVLSPFLVLLIIGLIYNIYQRIRSEKKLKIIQEQENKHKQFVIQQSKLAEIGEIFSSIAHQWKNPLVEISAIAQEQLYKNDTKNINSYVDDIMIQVSYMSDTINEFQNFITPSYKKSLFDIAICLEATMKIMAHTIKYNYIDISINKHGVKNFMVLGYKNEFMQTILNIFNNAKDQIIQARENKLIKRGKIIIDIYNEHDKIVISIKDNAGGIKSENINHIFEAYFTTKKSGHGIGLYMSKLIIEDKMQGSIEAKNCENGACFTIKLDSK